MAPETTPLDPESPWPWLDPFTETASGVFGGRDDDVRAVVRGVLASPVCVLFGRSGLGKTSLLLAGVFPLLRAQRLLPVAVRRLEYGTAAPSVSAQLQRALDAAAADENLRWRGAVSLGHKTADVTSLWERLHEREEHFVDGQQRRWTPVFVLDQFEEVFTLESDEARRRALFEELGDLLENRVPPAVAARSEADDSSLDRIDFDSQPYRFLIALREDFLPDLEHWADLIPRLGPNRYRLLPLSDRGALEAIQKTGGRLVDSASAQTIVQFLGRQMSQGVRARDERRIEPALLSLVCASLNADRLAKTPRRAPQLDVADLETRGSQILDRFYDDAFAPLDSDIRTSAQVFIESNLITPSGSRRPYPSEAVDPSLRAALATLERRRLLRTEVTEQGDYVELVHDRLAGVALQRAVARQRLAEEAARLLKEREAASTEVLKQRAALAEMAEERAHVEQQRARAEQARAEDAVRAAHRVRRWMWGVATIAVFAAFSAGVAGYLAYIAAQQRELAEESKRIAEARTKDALNSNDALLKALAVAKAAQQGIATLAESGAISQAQATTLLAQVDRGYASATTNFKQYQDCPSGRRIYPQIARDADRTVLATKLIPALRAAGFTVPPVEAIAPDKMPRESAVRYFRSDDSGGAAAAVDALKNAGLADVSAQAIAGYENSTAIRPCHFELWLGRALSSTTAGQGPSREASTQRSSVGVTPDVLQALAPAVPAGRAAGYAESLTSAMKRFDIDTPERAAAFLAIVAAESGGFRLLVENLNYPASRLMQVWPALFPDAETASMYEGNPEKIGSRVYANRMGNGGEESGDGFRFRGRGFLMVTGRDNYRAAAVGTGVPFDENPDLLAQPENAALQAAWFWKTRGLNELADANAGDDQSRDFQQIVRRTTGGLIGLPAKVALWERARTLFGAKGN